MRKFVIGMVSGAVFAAGSAAAIPGEKLEVLGVHVADELATAEKALSLQGYKKQSDGLDNCNTTFDQRVSELAKAGQIDFLAHRVTCSRSYSKGEYRVVMNYLLSPRGFLVSEVEYSFRSPEDRREVEARLISKFGRPNERTMDTPGWLSSPAAGLGLPSLRYRYAASTHTLHLYGGTVMKDTFVGEIRKEVSRRMPKTRSSL